MKEIQIILIVIAIMSIILIIVDITRTYYKCPANKVIYKFVPRTFKEEQENPVPITEIVNNLLEGQEPWVGSFNVYNRTLKNIFS